LSKAVNEQRIALPQTLRREVTQAVEGWRTDKGSARLFGKDPMLWTGRDEAEWLGWLDVVARELRDADTLSDFAREVRAENLSDVLLLGMGGSSLGPEVLAKSLGSAAGFPKLHVLDSTDPQQIRRFEDMIDLGRTLFIVSSKSGTTLEPSVLLDYFFARATAVLGGAAAKRFVAITDPGSRLQETAQRQGFRRVFAGIASIGGRYSVLSKFGLVPLAVTGHDVRAFLNAAGVMAQACGPQCAPADNPGVMLGLTIGVLAGNRRDKLTLIASPSIAGFGAWVEQLVAESTGKDGKGIIPIADEPLGEPPVYDSHRLFVYLRDAAAPDATQERAADALERAGHPVVHITVPSPAALAQEFYRFEIATAVAGAVLGINPFDQPDVEASKVATREMTQVFETAGALPSAPPVLVEGDLALYADTANADALRKLGAGDTLHGWLRAHLARLADGDYFPLLAYLDATDERLTALARLRAAVRERLRAATCLQIGPRYLHSTGQAHKGGPNSGVFLAVTVAPNPDLAIPGRTASFGVIAAAQAQGDLRVLGERGRRVLRAHIAGDVDDGIATLAKAATVAMAALP
jgi:transaldolase / glucose-6-phosphate isomerase